MIVGLIASVVGILLAAVVGHSMGIRLERSRHARWAEIQAAQAEEARVQHGVRLTRIRVER